MSKFFQDCVSTDEGYLLIRDNPRCIEEKVFIESLWERYQPFADRHFLSEASRQFQPRFWEMYLGTSLLELGLSLQPTNGGHGPDFLIAYESHKIWIEAIAPGNGEGNDSVPDYDTDGEVHIGYLPEERILLRLISAIREKAAKFERYIQDSRLNLTQGDSQVIAVTINTVSWASLDDGIPNIIKAVFPFGNQYFRMDRNTGGVIGGGRHYRPEIFKNSGEVVRTDFFLDDSSCHISGILFNSINSRNYPISLGEDYSFLHNPRAVNPIPKDVFASCFQYFVNQEDETYSLEVVEPS